ncbi:MAG: hypothetical protein ACRC0L_07205 [Angustibacter sp.]
MTSTIPAGARLTLLTPDRRVALRTLAGFRPCPHASVPVLASTEALALADTMVYVPTSGGLVTASATLIDTGGPVILQLGSDVRVKQRRAADRTAHRLEVLIAVPDRYGHGQRVVTGHSTDTSAGGLRLELDCPVDVMTSLDNLYPNGEVEAELLLPNGQRAPAVLSVVEVGRNSLRTAISSLAPSAREQLAHPGGDSTVDMRAAGAGRHRAPDALGYSSQGVGH